MDLSMKKYPTNQQRTAKYFENFNREKILKLLVSNDQPVIFDIGANLGQSLEEFYIWWKQSEIHCFEPQIECWKTLEKIRNDVSDATVFINKFAVGNKSEKSKEFYSHNVDNTQGTSGFNKINLSSLDSIYLNNLKKSSESNTKIENYKAEINTKREVEVFRMDDYINNLNLERIDLVKIDTQGHEPEVLEGFGERLKDVNVIITELMFYDYYERSLSFTDLENFLLPAGFSLYDINHISKNPMNGRTDWIDVIYVNKEVRNNLI
jgi:FkbM family methyltransferase